jgi:hypothetical protein
MMIYRHFIAAFHRLHLQNLLPDKSAFLKLVAAQHRASLHSFTLLNVRISLFCHFGRHSGLNDVTYSLLPHLKLGFSKEALPH